MQEKELMKRMQENLIDAYWLFVNPVLLGQGIPLFKNVTQKTRLVLLKNNSFSSGVVCLNYGRSQD
jgi:dihydrofolate reductase